MLLTLSQLFCLANIIVKLMAPALENTLKLNPDIIHHGRFGFLKFDNAVSLLPKKDFSPFLDTNPVFAMKMSKQI